MSPEPIPREPARNVEVVRKPDHVLLINLASPHQTQIQEVLRILEDRAITDWPHFLPPGEVGGVFRVNDIESPKFFAKKRHESLPEDLSDRLSVSRQAVREALQDLEEEGTELEDKSIRIKNEKIFQLRQDLAQSSIANEINTAPIVERIINGNDTRDLIGKTGYRSLQFVEPLVGVIDREGKTLIYEYVEGRQLDDLSLTEQQDIRLLAGGLVDLFLDAGLVPADLSPSQFLIGQKGKVYMLDTELYFKD